MSLDNKDILKPQPAPQGEGLYRWVKASERLPEGRVITRWNHAGNPEWIRIDLLDKQQIEMFDNVSTVSSIEWLEPLPSQPTGDVSILLEAFREIQKTFIENWDSNQLVSGISQIIKTALSSYQSSINK